LGFTCDSIYKLENDAFLSNHTFKMYRGFIQCWIPIPYLGRGDKSSLVGLKRVAAQDAGPRCRGGLLHFAKYVDEGNPAGAY